MNNHYSLVLPYPPSANRRLTVARGRMVKTAEAREYKEVAGWLTKAIVPDPLPGDVKLRIILYRPSRRSDIDNPLKVLLDSLQGVLYENDKQIRELHVYLKDDKRNPRVDVLAWSNTVEATRPLLESVQGEK